MWFTQGESNEIGRIDTGGGGRAPGVTKLTPSDGSAEGGTEVTITGLNLEGAEGGRASARRRRSKSRRCRRAP